MVTYNYQSKKVRVKMFPSLQHPERRGIIAPKCNVLTKGIMEPAKKKKKLLIRMNINVFLQHSATMSGTVLEPTANCFW